MNTKKITLVFLGMVLIFSSCLDKKFEDINSSTIPADFEFKTIQDYEITVKTLNNNDEPLVGVYIEMYTENPLDSNGIKKINSKEKLFFKGTTTENGTLNCKLSPATTVDSLTLIIHQIGLPSIKTVALKNQNINILIGGKTTEVAQSATGVKASRINSKTDPTRNGTGEFLILDSWNNSGVPKNLEKRDVISSALLSDINASLPEYKSLPNSHPEYFENNLDGNIELVKDAEVWVTFVHEGATYLNSLCYYTHNTNNAPTTVSDVKNPIVIFPNMSYPGSGGALNSGDKVQLMYYNETTKSFSKIFPAGVSVSWLFRANSWNSAKKDILTGYNTFFSDHKLNIESDVKLKKHNVILKDDTRKLLLIGFEDIRRDQNSDNDFNDAVIYATVTPYEAVNTTKFRTTAPKNDIDKDGVSDEVDEFPTDPKRAFNNYYPTPYQKGTLAFEDLWPTKGDYDFNDLVIDYQYNQITNAQNQLVALDVQLTVRAIGALYKNGFGIEFNTDPSNIKSVNGQKFTENILSIASNGTENGQNKAVIMAFDNAFSILKHPGNGIGVNSVQGGGFQTPVISNISIEFNNPISINEFGTPPYNPFIFKDGIRSCEVHLPGTTPTNLADKVLFGTKDDNSSISNNKFYMSKKNLPWAINLPVQFDYPFEKNNISNAYILFDSWAISGGTLNKDWYINNNGYREINLIYSK